MTDLRKFWIRFDRLPKPTPVNVGCGVTAYSRDDALCLIRQYIFGQTALPAIIELIEDVTLDQIEQKHARPNIGDVEPRGIWFPQGFAPE